MIEKKCEGRIEPCGWVLCEKRGVKKEKNDALNLKIVGFKKEERRWFWADEAHDRIKNNDRLNGVKER